MSKTRPPQDPPTIRPPRGPIPEPPVDLSFWLEDVNAALLPGLNPGIRLILISRGDRLAACLASSPVPVGYVPDEIIRSAPRLKQCMVQDVRLDPPECRVMAG
jgi:hypothetical protein